MRFETIAIHTGERPDRAFGSISTPIYQTSTFAFEDVGKTRGYDYSRTANPTRKVLEDTIAQLEGGKAGFAFATGMAAETTVMHLLKAGDHVVSGDDIYAGTHRLFDRVMRNFGLDFTFVRTSDRQSLEAAMERNTKMLWLETPSNPLLNITDLEMAIDVAKQHGLLVVVDNTFATPYFQRPIDYGADVVVHSTTKYLNGHCDVVGGAVITANAELAEEVQFLLNATGTCASPFDSWLVLRGIETLAVRMRRHESNAMAVSEYLKRHPAVQNVFYPGLDSHPGHKIAAKQMTGFGGIVSFEVRGGKRAVRSLLRRLRLFILAESLGGATSLVSHPETMTHVAMPKEYRKRVGISSQLVRLSVGLENVEDLIEDLAQALEV